MIKNMKICSFFLERTQIENVLIHQLPPRVSQPGSSSFVGTPQLQGQPVQFSQFSNSTGRGLKTTAYTRDLQRRPPYPVRGGGGGGAIYLDPNALMTQASASLASAEDIQLESDYSSLTNGVFSTTDIGPSLR